MNIADLLFKMILGAGVSNTMPNPVEISKQILAQLKHILKSLIILFIGSVIFCLLLGYLVDRTLTQLDGGSFQLTNSIILLSVLLALDALVLLWSLKKASAKEEVTAVERRPEPRSPDSPIETAIAALILDFLKEREANRVRAEGSASRDSQVPPPST